MNPLDADLVARRLQPPPTDRPARAILDTDTFNEIDDQFALAYLLRRPERVALEAVHAAPFKNNRSASAEEGMLKSADEARKVIGMMGESTPVVEGSRRFCEGEGDMVDSPAVEALIERAMATPADGEPLYVVAIGAITNVTSAIWKRPEIRERIVVCWLGGNSPMPGVEAAQSGWLRPAAEFNFYQDAVAAKGLFDSGVPLVWFPCWPASGMLTTSVPELRSDLAGRSTIGTYLTDIVEAHAGEHGNDTFAYGKQIWDLAPCAWLTGVEGVHTRVVPSPRLADTGAWEPGEDDGRHRIRETFIMNRSALFKDVFRALAD